MAAPEEVPLRPAGTVLLVRDGSAGVEVFHQVRATTMPFAAGMTAFPGGAVDPTDADLPPWSGRSPADWNLLLGRPDGVDLVVATVRELFEEVGVLLTADPVRADPSWLARVRDEVTAHRMSIAQVYRELGTAVPGDVPMPWGRWITPVGPNRRYDTYFLLVPLPDGQVADLLTSEASDGGWATPQNLLDRNLSGDLRLLPPTLVTLTELADHPTVAAAAAAVRSMAPVEPELISRPGEPAVVQVGGRNYVASPTELPSWRKGTP